MLAQRKIIISSSLKKSNKTTNNDISLLALCKEHLVELSAVLREADRAELTALYGENVLQGLLQCQARSVVAVAFLYKGKIAAAAGVEPEGLLGRRACVWSWSGAQAQHCSKAFWKVSRRVLGAFLQLYPQLYAACDEHYAAAERYIRRLGGVRLRKMQLRANGPAFWVYEFNKGRKAPKQ